MLRPIKACVMKPLLLTGLIPFIFLLGLGWSTAGNAPELVSQTEFKLAKKKYGEFAVRRLKAWQQLVDNNISKPERLKLKRVNDFFNQAKFVSDIKHWKKKDYWATPFEFLSTDAGDCEDYVIAKYFTLKALGVPESKIYLTYVKSTRLKQSHMVLTYFKKPKSIPLVLDNLTDRILKATIRKDLIPIYSFNGKGLWLSKQRGKGKSIDGGSGQLKEWNQLLKKLEQ